MNTEEFNLWSLVIAAIAILISGGALWISWCTRKDQQEERKQQRTEARRAELLVSRETPHIVIRNVGRSTARNVEIEYSFEASGEVVIEGDFDWNVNVAFPVEELKPGEEVRVQLLEYLGGPNKLHLILTWTNDDDTEGRLSRTLLL